MTVHLPLTCCFPAAPQERRWQKAKTPLHLRSWLSDRDRAPLIPNLCICHFTPPSAHRERRICPAPGTGNGEGLKQLLPPCYCTTAPLVLGKHLGLCLGSTHWVPHLPCLLVKTAMREIKWGKVPSKAFVLCFVLLYIINCMFCDSTYYTRLLFQIIMHNALLQPALRWLTSR